MITVTLQFNKTPAREIGPGEYLDAPLICGADRESLRRVGIQFSTADDGTITTSGLRALELLESRDIEIVNGALYRTYGWTSYGYDYDDQCLAGDIYGVEYLGSRSDYLFYDVVDAVCWALDQAMADGILCDEDFVSTSDRIIPNSSEQSMGGES